MALAFDNEGQQTTSGSTTNGFSFTTAGSGRLLIVFSVNDVVENLTSITYNGVGLTSVTSKDGASGFVRCQMWYLINPASGANTLTATRPTGTGGFSISVTSYTGAYQSAQVDSFNSSATTTSPINPATTVVNSGCWLVAGASANGGTLAASTGSTARGSITGSSGQIGQVRMFDSNGTVGTGSQYIDQTTAVGSENTGIVVSIRPTLTYTLTMDQGSYTYTGYAIGFARTMVMAVGSYTLTGFSLAFSLVRKWIMQSKNSSSWTNGTKHTSSTTNQTKHTSTWTNKPKS